MKNKKLSSAIVLLALTVSIKIFPEETELELIWNETAEKNSSVVSAEHSYDSACLSLSTMDGSYSPLVTTSATSILPDGYDWKNSPDYSYATVSVTQPLPGGTSVGVSTSYSMTLAGSDGTRYISQTPNVTFTLSQSLFPFYAQGKIQNPEKLSLKQQKEYYYSQLLYTKKQQLENATQCYILCLIYRRKMEVYESEIEYIKERIYTLEELKKQGGSSSAEIAELENSKWSYEQSLAEVRISFEGYRLSLLETCGGYEVDFNNEELPSLKNEAPLLLTGNVKDPCGESLLLKKKMVETSRTLQRQNSAPLLSFSLKPEWSMEAVEESEWKSAWGNDSTCSWTASVSLSLTPLISSAVTKSGSSYKMEKNAADDSYNAYLAQKNSVKNQYKNLMDSFTAQLESAEDLYAQAESVAGDTKKLYESGAVSKLEYDSIVMQLKNRKASYECMRLYLWLYSWLYGMM